jgi:uncharacterized Fe-S center protein
MPRTRCGGRRTTTHGWFIALRLRFTKEREYMPSSVFFQPLKNGAAAETVAAAALKVYEACGGPGKIAHEDFVAVKIHVGEKGNNTHMPPAVCRVLGEKIRARGGQPFMIETSTLYKGERENAIKHFILAQKHGFTFEATGLPFLPADGLSGNTETEVAIPGKLNRTVKIAREILVSDALVSVAHVTGHLGAGFGATIKTLGMGLASRMGKMRQHSSMHPRIKTRACTFCKKCIAWCPEDAIIERNGKAFIVKEKCIGCGECVAVCRFEAVEYDWGMESSDLERHMAEHALGAIQHMREKCVHINIALNMTKDCDCMGYRQTKLIPDLGVMASTDPVAVDQAAMDMVRKEHGKDLAGLAFPRIDGRIQLSHGESIGLGSRRYELHEI